jgi:hypothetical protein
MSIDAKEIKRYKIRLIKKQDWLDCRKHLEALDSLFKECLDKEETRMLIDLMSRFTCSDEDTLLTFYLNQAKTIINDKTCTVANCIIGPTTDDEKPDSSQHICNPFRNMLKRNGGKHIVKNHFHYIKTFIASTKEKNIKVIILEDFIGSGKTIGGKINKCKELVARNKYIEESDFRVISFAAMEKGKQYIEGQGVKVVTGCILKRGITDFLVEPNLSAAKSSMLRMESLIFGNPRGHPYSFGYEQSEALYTKIMMKTTDLDTSEGDIHLDRAQNNVFPIFWWEKYTNGDPRKTLLYR